MTATPATRALDKAGISYDLHEYEYEGGHQIGEHAAKAIGADHNRVFKTLMLEVDSKPACVVIPVAANVKLKRAASALGGKSAQMMEPAKAERLTGFRVGGISPFGQKRRVPVCFDTSAFQYERVVINGGQRGVMVELSPHAAAEFLTATAADVTGL
ncbi:Cys-tRNA(Pro) deacylase [Donghicola sp. XS_ASV15]|uniref:Cys-tRNA(Pro) deacylase n=1 Tax=Donghicola sp. XS_ASV15 TaxID=3241295 RepID=UPI003512D6EB